MALVPPREGHKLLALGYGAPGSGKSNWAAAAASVLGRAIVIDVDGDGGRSILPQHKKNLEILQFGGDDPIKNMSEIATHDWKGEGFDLLIVDTVTSGAVAMLKYAANKGYFKSDSKGDAHIVFGPKDAAITQSLPQLADYGGGKWLVENWSEILRANQQDMHVLLLHHEDLDIPKKDDPGSVMTLGGPATFGRALLRSYPGDFPTIVRLLVKEKTGLDGKKTANYRAVASMDGTYTARIKHDKMTANPLADVVLERDPVTWWEQYKALFLS